ncbi:hypothetical protein Q3C01_13875 [Bradyrhizobium sp. UFLA05-109]
MTPQPAKHAADCFESLIALDDDRGMAVPPGFVEHWERIDGQSLRLSVSTMRAG